MSSARVTRIAHDLASAIRRGDVRAIDHWQAVLRTLEVSR